MPTTPEETMTALIALLAEIESGIGPDGWWIRGDLAKIIADATPRENPDTCPCCGEGLPVEPVLDTCPDCEQTL